ncbi:MAG: hypothetical protein ACYS3S_13450 [Planctomycetota bacterium]|jgi:hypothetical protein
MEKQKNSHRVKFSKIVCFILFILLCAVPCRAEVNSDDKTINIYSGVNYLAVSNEWTANLYPGAEVYAGIYAAPGSTINFYGGKMSNGYILALTNGTNLQQITVHGRNFAVYVKVNGQVDELELSGPSFHLVTGKYFNLTGFYGNGDPINLTFYGNIPINLVTLESSSMVIDIKPGNDQNNINLKSNGVVPVAVLTTDEFDAAKVDPATAEFAGAAPEHWSLEDVDGDGDDDVIFHFRTQELDLDQDSTEATLKAQLKSQTATRSTARVSSGSTVSGTDTVRIVTAKKSKK